MNQHAFYMYINDQYAKIVFFTSEEITRRLKLVNDQWGGHYISTMAGAIAKYYPLH